jgi:hypothetical protein
VQADRLALDAADRFAVVLTDVRAGHESVAASVLWRELDRLALEGPLPEEVDHERAVITGHLDDPRSDAEEACAAAESHVTGVPFRTSAELRQDLAGLTVVQVREAAATMRDAAVLGVPEPLEPSPAGLARLPKWSADVVTGRQFVRRRLTGVPKGACLVVGQDGASVVLADDERITVRWADAVGLVRTGSADVLLLGRDGFSIPLSAADWRDGDEALELVRAAVPADLQVTDDETLDESGGVLLLRQPLHRMRESAALSRNSFTLVGNAEWSALVVDGERSVDDLIGDLVNVLGRTTVLLVRQGHADLEYVLLRGGREVDRHRWGAAPGDSRLLAEATGRPEPAVDAVLRVTEPPGETLARFMDLLGLPPELPDLLAGRTVDTAHRVDGLGIAGGFRASVRGDFDPPADQAGWMYGWRRLSKTRPPWYRLTNAAGALLAALGLWLLLTLPDLWPASVRWGLVGFAAIGLLSCLWDVRPPARRPPADEPRAADLTPSG